MIEYFWVQRQFQQREKGGGMSMDPPPPHRTDLVARHTILVLTLSVYLLRIQLLVFFNRPGSDGVERGRGSGLE